VETDVVNQSLYALAHDFVTSLRYNRRHEFMANHWILIGHIDSGVDQSHSEFTPDGIAQAMGLAPGGDPDGHGTHTAALLVGRQWGAAHGVARIASAAASEGDSQPDAGSRIAAALEWTLDLNCPVICVAMGVRRPGPRCQQALNRALGRIREQDALVFCAAGNEGPGSWRYPASAPECLAVGALDEAGRPWVNTSTWQDQPMLWAPGERILSAKPGGGGIRRTGTSMAAAIAAGQAARWKFEGASNLEIRRLLRERFRPQPGPPAQGLS
jgi:subtilisin family serine protease